MTLTQNTIKSIRNIMREDNGVSGDSQRIEQLVWMIFLKIFDELEDTEWSFDEDYVSPLKTEHKWNNWAKNQKLTGEDLLIFVNNLIKDIKDMPVSQDDDKRKLLLRQVFEDCNNYMKSGITFRRVVNIIDEIDFKTQDDRHLFNDIYESILVEMNDASAKGEFYTPRAVTQFIVDMIDVKVGDKIIDPSCGTGGFLICAYNKLKDEIKDLDELKEFQDSIKGIEWKPLPHLLCQTNMLTHGIFEPNIKHDDALSHSIADISENDKVDVIITNPPFGGTVPDSDLINFPNKFRTKESMNLFMVLNMRLLKDEGRCGIVLPDGFLFSEESTSQEIKKELLENFNLHTIVKLPKGVFKAGIETNLLFFKKGEPTKEIWFFEHPYPEGYKSYSKTKPIKLEEFENLEKKWWNNREENDYAWKVSIDKVKNYNLDFKNPKKIEDEEVFTSEELVSLLNKSIDKSKEILNKI